MTRNIKITPYTPSDWAIAREWMGEAGARAAGYKPDGEAPKTRIQHSRTHFGKKGN